ncbi:hypothetical protein [Candidatus Binatus sp.]|uniref:hypothetical protein n=1 Tax=Candidatus Binatus sp. TaxID=2811406 RepID=UPI003CC59908
MAGVKDVDVALHKVLRLRPNADLRPQLRSLSFGRSFESPILGRQKSPERSFRKQFQEVVRFKRADVICKIELREQIDQMHDGAGTIATRSPLELVVINVPIQLTQGFHELPMKRQRLIPATAHHLFLDFSHFAGPAH